MSNDQGRSITTCNSSVMLFGKLSELSAYVSLNDFASVMNLKNAYTMSSSSSVFCLISST
jgi:hypothetical protein